MTESFLLNRQRCRKTSTAVAARTIIDGIAGTMNVYAASIIIAMLTA
jgi:hypothetical protein